MTAFYGIRSRVGLTDLKHRLGLVPREPTPLEAAIAGLAVAKTTGTPGNDPALIERIVGAYRKAVADFPGYGDSMWSGINGLAVQVHDMLMTGTADAVTAALDNPHTTNLFLGFDNPVAAPYGFAADDRNLLSNETGPGAKMRIYMALRRLAEAVGAARIANPETMTGTALTPDGYLDRIEDALGIRLAFPNFYPMEEGIRTARGIVSYRPLQAIYQAYRLARLGARSVVEIGAGLGRTAYFAHCLGIRDYTIIDIPLSTVAQAHFLSRALGSDQIGLAGEPRRPIRIVGPAFIEGCTERFDVVLNVDSLSELDIAVAQGYVDFARRSAKTFLSINREWDGAPQPAALLRGVPTIRYPYWMRDGYVEEIAALA